MSLYEEAYSRPRAYDSPNVKEVVASGLGCDDNTTAERGVDIAILGVDVAILGLDIVILGVDIAIFGVDIEILGVDIAVLSVDIAILGVNIAILRRQEKGWGLMGGGGGGSRVRRLEAGWSVGEFVDTRSHNGRGAPCYKPILGVRSGWGLGCRGTVRRSVRGLDGCLILPSHQKPSMELGSPPFCSQKKEQIWTKKKTSIKKKSITRSG